MEVTEETGIEKKKEERTTEIENEIKKVNGRETRVEKRNQKGTGGKRESEIQTDTEKGTVVGKRKEKGTTTKREVIKKEIETLTETIVMTKNTDATEILT